MKFKTGNALALLLAAVIWGAAFVAQTTGGDAIGPFAFNGIRMLMGALVLVPVILVMDKVKPSGRKPVTKAQKKQLWLGGFLSGAALFVATNLQQVALTMGTGAGKAGFLTTIYILIVPIIGLFLKKKCGWNVWVGVVLALAGIYLLTNISSWQLETADILLFLCALVFAIQILFIDHFAPLVDNVRLASIQFLVCGVLTLIPMVIFDWKCSIAGFLSWLPSLGTWDAWIALLYAGILSSGVAYTLQIIGQNNFNPTIASIIMSMESVFAALAGLVLLNQTLSTKEVIGCAVIFAAIIIAQLPLSKADRT